MKLATMRTDSPDGSLVVVNSDLTQMVCARSVAERMIDALDEWDMRAPQLQALAHALEAGSLKDAMPFDASLLAAPLPRAYAWIDGTSYLSHMERARALRGATLPDDFRSEPLMTERVSVFLGAQDPVPLADPQDDMDIEGEVGVILGNVPAGAGEIQAAAAIRLVTVINDISLRSILVEKVRRDRPVTLAAKPYPTMAPIAMTPDELGPAWNGGLVHLVMHCAINGQTLAEPHGGHDASFSFPQLIAYCAEHRPLPTGTVLAAGTLSNKDDDRGGACIAERRLIEQKRTGAPATPYLRVGDTLEISMRDDRGIDVFGTIRQTVVAARK